MASRRKVVSRRQREEVSSPVPPHSGRKSGGSHRQPTALPPYQPLSCPLTLKAKQSLINIYSDAEDKKYEQHLKIAVRNITNFVAESNDRWYDCKEEVERLARKRAKEDGEDGERDELELQAEERAKAMQRNVDKITAEAEKALREVIDLQMEYTQQPAILESMAEEAVTSADAANAAIEARRAAVESRRNKRRRTMNDSDDEDQENDDEQTDEQMDEAEEILDISGDVTFQSPTELLKRAKEQYAASYQAQDLYTRYATHNDYKGFKRVIHDAQNPGENAPPVPHPSTWFSDEAAISNTPAARRRRMASQTNDSHDSGDDEIVVTGETASLKCPLTLRTFEEPYSNNICKHTFEKATILQFHLENATAFADFGEGRRGRGIALGPKKVKCPATNCDAMLELDDFYDDQIILRQVRRQAAQEAAEMHDDDVEDDEPVGSQMPRRKNRTASDDAAEDSSQTVTPERNYE